MSCVCQGCGENYIVDVNISNDLWERIKPAGSGGLLCGRCIMTSIENRSKNHKCFHLISEATIRNRFDSIINGRGLTIPRQIVGYVIDELITNG